jgi:hypothetical protein
VASILGGRDEELPRALFDSDFQGRETAKSLRSGLYVNQPDLILEIGTFTGLTDSEIEDLIEPDVLINEMDRWQRGADVPFSDVFSAGSPIVPQIESWASKHNVPLAKPGWKVELATRVKRRLLSDGVAKAPSSRLDLWAKLFDEFN